MNIRILRLATFMLFVVAMPCLAQTGTGKVTFYSIGLSAKEQLKVSVVPVGTIPFTGWLFDGDQKMAHAQRGRFMTFVLSTGEHRFTVPYHSSGPGKEPFPLTIRDGGHYCIRLSAKYKSALVVPVMWGNSQIEQVPCEQALNEAGSYKRIDIKRVDPSVRQKLEQSSSFPKEN